MRMSNLNTLDSKYISRSFNRISIHMSLDLAKDLLFSLLLLWLAVKFALNCDRKQSPCGVAGPACSSSCCRASPSLSPPASNLASPLQGPPTLHPRGPPPARVRTMRACRGAGRPAPLPGQNTGSQLPVLVTTPAKKTKQHILILLFLVLWSLAQAIISDSHLPVSTSCCYSESWWIRQNLGPPILLQSQRHLGKSQIIADAQTDLATILVGNWLLI